MKPILCALAILILSVTDARAAGSLSLPDSSLYHLDSRWQRDDGTAVKLADFRGGVKIISMFFTGCDNICPMLMGQLKSLESAMSEPLRKKVGFILVTMDSKDDSPAALGRYRKETGLSAQRWTLLRGNADDTRELAGLLGVRYTPKQDDGQMGHTGLIAILDGNGRILAQTQAITDQKDFLARLTRAVEANP
jgi:protein SCO1